jgi:hypothetical protein
MEDLIALVADQDMKAALKGILERRESLSIRPITYEIKIHSGHDSGVYKSGPAILGMYTGQFNYAIAMLDWDGCGHEDKSASEIAENIQSRLNSNGWKGKSKVIVIDPELEIWVWSDSPYVAKCLGWDNGALKTFLSTQATRPGTRKPADPKKVFGEVIKKGHTANSSSTFSKLADSIGFKKCTDPAFTELKDILKCWFPVNNPS